MIREVFDANVFVAGIPATSGTLAALIDHWRAGSFQVVVSEHIVDRVRDAWNKPYWRRRLTLDQAERAIRLIRRRTESTPINVHLEGVATHAEDDLVLATAVSANVDYLVTSDNLFRNHVKSYQGVDLISPRGFLTLLEEVIPVDE